MRNDVTNNRRVFGIQKFSFNHQFMFILKLLLLLL